MNIYPHSDGHGIIDLVEKRDYDTLFAKLCEAEELIREIRDNEVNAQDEAAKFLRDHRSSELSKLRNAAKGCLDSLEKIGWPDCAQTLQELLFPKSAAKGEQP